MRSRTKAQRNAIVAKSQSRAVPAWLHVGDGAELPAVTRSESAIPSANDPDPGRRFCETRWVNDRGVASAGEFAELSATIEMTTAYDDVVVTSGDGVNEADATAVPLTTEAAVGTGSAVELWNFP